VIVETTTGAVRGKERRGVATWRGIPYATAARFRPPRAVVPWTGVRDALEFGPFAMQVRDPRAAMMSGVTEKTQMSEDCLVLNIYAPLASAQTPRPVLVWIHGGAFVMGAGSQPLYDGTSFAANHDLVVVTINYRLGLFGLMYLGDLLGEEYAAGNAALLDQIAALRWVRDNIAAFGGDPAAVTVMGESAGAVSVAHLLAAPDARGLYQRAILQSGALGLIPRTREDATQLATEIAAQLGVPPTELPSISADKLVAVQQQLSLTRGLGAFSPFVDGSTIPEPPLDAIRNGVARDVPTVIGSNRDEWMLFDTFLGHASTQLVVAQVRERLGAPLMDRLHASYRAARIASTGNAPATAASASPGNAPASAAPGGMPGSIDARAWVDLIGDMAFLIPALQLAEAHCAHAPVYMYRFDFGTPMLGAAHALELPFVWNMLDGSFAQLLLGGDAAAALPLAAAMHGTWASFIRTGRPDAESTWPTYDLDRRATRLFDRNITIADDPGRELREMWDQILAPLRR
jgi:para-nitrobenzyl esterase